MPILSDSLGISLKNKIIWPNNFIICYEITIAKEISNKRNISRKTSRLFIGIKEFCGLRYGFKW